MVGIDPRTGKRWRNGRRLVSGGRVVDLPPVITTTATSVNRYSPRYLSEGERVRLDDLRRERRTMREIALLKGRSPSAISRELARGADASGRHRPFEARRRALGRRRLHRPSRQAKEAALRGWVAARLVARRGPAQVSRRPRRESPHEPHRWLSAETIHQAVYPPDLGGLPREPPGRVLRHRRRHRVPRRQAQARRSGPVTGMTPIHQRPARALDRVEPGHWEADLIMGAADRTAIVTLVERTTRCTLPGHPPDGRHDSATARDAVVMASAACRRTCA